VNDLRHYLIVEDPATDPIRLEMLDSLLSGTVDLADGLERLSALRRTPQSPRATDPKYRDL